MSVFLFIGCLERIELSITGPQPAVLPLHHGHHIIFLYISILTFGQKYEPNNDNFYTTTPNYLLCYVFYYDLYDE